MPRLSRLALALFVSVVSACDGEEQPACTAAELQSRLDVAPPGSVVRAGACRVEGRFNVPAGVTLEGSGRAATVLAASETVVTLEGDGATVASLAIESGGGHAILAHEDGSVSARDVDVRATLGGSAILFNEMSAVHLTDVTVTGPVTRANATSIPDPATSTVTALFGVALLDVDEAELTRVSVSGFAVAGLVASTSTLTWSGGASALNLGIGVWIDGGSAAFDGVTIEDTLRGFRGTSSYGLASGRGAAINTNAVSVRTTEGGFGLFHDGGRAEHDGLQASGHAAGAILAQRTSFFILSGQSTIADNSFGGLMLVEARGVTIEDATFENTSKVRRMIGDWGNVEIGDGMLIVAPSMGTTIRRTTFTGNGRAGLLVDLAGTDTSRLAIEDVTVDVTGTAFGVVAQNGTVQAGWDSRVTRSAAATINDQAFLGGLDVIRLVAVNELPPAGSIIAIVGPCE